MISKTIGFFGVHYFQTNPNGQHDPIVTSRDSTKLQLRWVTGLCGSHHQCDPARAMHGPAEFILALASQLRFTSLNGSFTCLKPFTCLNASGVIGPQECRKLLWENFVLDAAINSVCGCSPFSVQWATDLTSTRHPLELSQRGQVRNDVAFGHLFFWALRAVESSPQANGMNFAIPNLTDSGAEEWRERTLCRCLQLMYTLYQIYESMGLFGGIIFHGSQKPLVSSAESVPRPRWRCRQMPNVACTKCKGPFAPRPAGRRWSGSSWRFNLCILMPWKIPEWKVWPIWNQIIKLQNCSFVGKFLK